MGSDNKSHANSHTHCQAAQSSRTSQNLSKSVTFPIHGRQEKKARLHNNGYKQLGRKCQNQSINIKQRSVLN